MNHLNYFVDIFYHEIAEANVTLVSQLNTMQKDLDETKTFVMENRPLRQLEDIITLQQIIEKYNWNVPIDQIENFTTFDSTIIDNVYSDLVSNINILEINYIPLNECFGLTLKKKSLYQF